MVGWTDYPTDGDAVLQTLAGRLRVLRGVEGPGTVRRDLLVLVPVSHGRNGDRYPVLYMHDGQNLFDPATSYAGAWRVGRALESLRKDGIEAIVVGVPNAGDRRISEYSPFPDARVGGGDGEAYINWLADTVKPLIDGAFDTRRGPENTCIAGSSMGGLISLYGLFRRPDIFGTAGALSPALWFARRAIFPWLETVGTVSGRVYLDAGTAEGPLLMADVARFRDQLIGLGFRLGENLRCLMEKGGHHDEASWGRRLPGALNFMLGGPAVGRETP